MDKCGRCIRLFSTEAADYTDAGAYLPEHLVTLVTALLRRVTAGVHQIHV